MNNPPESYKLVLRGVSMFGRYKIFRGSDHLLLLEQTYFIQRYFRFFYRDIQGILAVKTIHFFLWLGVLGFSVLLFLVAALPDSAQRGGDLATGHKFFVIVSIILFVISGLFLAFGRTCKISIATKVQNKRLGGVLRWRQWLKMKKILIPLIEEEQGRIADQMPPGKPAETTPPEQDYGKFYSQTAVQPPPGA